jgi:diguanylate cyclase (GGDEF)-like protein
MADVNELKKTNDNLGHAAGDETLRRAAQALRSVFRAEDIVARIGGDEFAVLLLNTDAAAAAIALARIRSSLVRLNASHTQTPVSLALGAGTVGQGSALANALVEADAQMYVDKSIYRRNAF